MTARSPRAGRPSRSPRRAARRARRRSLVIAVALAGGLTLGWLPTVSQAQQTPESWNGDQHTVLRSGLTVDLSFAAEPGVTVASGAGTLGTAAGYADGVGPDTAAETYAVAEDRPAPSGSWRTLGTLRLTFSRPVRNPRLHLSGLAATAGGSASALRLSVTGGTPAGPALTARSPWQGWTAGGGTLGPAGADAGANLDPAGTVELDGTFDTATLRIERRDQGAKPPALRPAVTVTLDEALGSAPSGFGNASHVISDLFLGSDAISPTPRLGLAARGGSAAPAGRLQPGIQPGRVEHTANDPAVDFPGAAAIGGYYDLTVPVSPGQGGATLAGWIDFARDGRFDATERAQVDVAPGAGSATLEWIVPPNVAAGDTWARLRIARDPAQVVSPDGFADAGEVEDQLIHLTVDAAAPEITSPVAGAAVGQDRPVFRGDGGVAGATLAVQEGSVTVCRTQVGSDGSWSCRPDAPLAAGDHQLVPVETTGGGVTQHGDPVRITVSTAPPAAPRLTLPDYTNDPGLLLSGTGTPGTMVVVTEGGPENEVCRTAVGADRTWSCLPVEDLVDGPHVLTATAVDAAGNPAAGKPVTLTVDTVAPAKPVLARPGPGEELHVLRPKLAGTGEPGATVTVVTAGNGALCSAVAAVDGSWVCNAQRDLGMGDQLLTPTATDRAGNGTAGDPVRVHVVVASPSVSPSASPSAPASPSVPASPSGAGSASVSESGTESALPSPSPSASVSASASASSPASLSASPSASASDPAGASASTSASASASASAGASASASDGASASTSTSASASASAGSSASGSDSASPSAGAPPSTGASGPPSSPSSGGSGPGTSGSTSASSSAGLSAGPGPSSSPSTSPDPAPPVAGDPPVPIQVPDTRVLPLAFAGSVPPPQPVLAPLAGAERPAPPPDAFPTGRHASLGGWRAAACGIFLILAGMTLITRRVLARGPGSRRR